MIISEGRKENALSKFEPYIQAERNLVSEYLGGKTIGSIYDYLITDLFMIDTNFKYLEDILSNYYEDWMRFDNEKLENLTLLSFKDSKDYINRKRDEIDRLVEALKFFDVHNQKYKFQDFKSYSKSDLFNFLSETDKLREEFKKKKGSKEAQKVYDGPNLLVVRPKSYEASCLYGAGTRWCTSSKTSSSHYENYAETGSLYYFLTKNVDSSNKFYKVALYVTESGEEKWYDATDRELGENEIELLKSAYGDAFKEVRKDFESLNKLEGFENKIFNYLHNNTLEFNLLDSPKYDLSLTLVFKEQSPEYPYLKGYLYLTDKDGKEIDLGTYLIRITTKCKIGICYFECDLSEIKESDFKNFNLGDMKIYYSVSTRGKEPREIYNSLSKHIFSEIYDKVKKNKDFMNSLTNQSVILNYAPFKGYSFAKRDRGLIKKLIDWFDNGGKGGRLDFLVDSGILRREGDEYIEISTGNSIVPRGYLGTFFSALAGADVISSVRTRGGKSLMVKGPNYERFIQGVPMKYVQP
jgi:hypothetical protein